MCLHEMNATKKRNVCLTFQDVDKNIKKVWVAEEDYNAFIEASEEEAFISKFFPYLSVDEIDFILNAIDMDAYNVDDVESQI